MKKLIYIFIIIGFLLLLFGCQSTVETKPNDEEDKEEEPIEVETPEFDLTKLGYYQYLNDDNPVITITVTGFGTMKAQLFPNIAPNTVANFINYIENNAFIDSGFHRIIKGFMIQGGIVKQSNPPIHGEFDLSGFYNPLRHTWGVISMARTDFIHSATSQFFIVHEAAPYLNGAYASFGGLIEGFDVLESIANVRTNAHDAPIDAVIIENITIDLNGYENVPVKYYQP